ncbi:Rv1733c family protein [Rhodococcoides navarretei]|uniref:Transmembrane protein n=1 Tax=Rhodococcus navarretei TaxID=3128981 RepID=A0ABU9CUB9_9NOCA
MRRKLTGQHRSGRADLAGYPNPLLRDCDVRQARIKHWVTTLLIVMIPVSLWIGLGTHADQQQRLENQRGSIHQVTATTTDIAEVAPVSSTEFGASGAAATAVDSRWVYRGVEHTGRVSVDTGSPVGTTTPIWVDDSGDLSVRPLTSSDVVAASIFGAIGSWVLMATLLVGAYLLMRFRYDLRRDAEWDRDIADLLRQH